MKPFLLNAVRGLSILAAGAALFLAIASAHAADDTLFDDLGGRDGVEKIAQLTTANFLADPRVRAQFDNTTMDRFEKLLSQQFCVVAGGPCEYKGRTMAEAHKALGLTNADFNAVVEDLEAAMDKADIPYAVQTRFLARLAPMQHDVVTK
jgi:hemoglobin